MGYTGGTTPDPTYHRLGDHTESVQIDYDPGRISYERLLDVFFAEHNPVHPPFSAQYRSAIFVADEQQRSAAERAVAQRQASGGRAYTTVEPLARFYRAEDYHQKYRLRNRASLMSEFHEIYPDEESFVDSTAAARVNGWLDGCGEPGTIDAEIARLGLSERGVLELCRLLRDPGRILTCR